MATSAELPLAVTCGDPAGVGPEVVAAWLRANPAEVGRVVPIGPARWVESLGVKGVAVGAGDFSAEPGKPSVEGAAVALAALEEAAAGSKAGRYAGAVTGPVSKTWMQRAGFAFPGQTEFFAARWGGEPTMAFAGGKLRVVLATWHIPLAEVPRALTKEVLTRAVTQAERLALRLRSGQARALRQGSGQELRQDSEEAPRQSSGIKKGL